VREQMTSELPQAGRQARARDHAHISPLFVTGASATLPCLDTHGLGDTQTRTCSRARVDVVLGGMPGIGSTTEREAPPVPNHNAPVISPPCNSGRGLCLLACLLARSLACSRGSSLCARGLAACGGAMLI